MTERGGELDNLQIIVTSLMDDPVSGVEADLDLLMQSNYSETPKSERSKSECYSIQFSDIEVM